MDDLTKKHCVPCEGGTVPLTDAGADALLEKLDGWERGMRLFGYRLARISAWDKIAASINQGVDDVSHEPKSQGGAGDRAGRFA
jgi:hypothetical protein